MIRQTLYVDDSIKSAQILINDLRAEIGPLGMCQLPAANIIFDVLAAIGIPPNGIQIALGADYEQYQPMEYEQQATDACCFICHKPATQLVTNIDGAGRLACDLHAYEYKIYMARAKYAKEKESDCCV